ncbi:hypothetical protein KDV73_22285 [Providencia stuartii]|uniref:hypothetical protein n=1 Tax=Providencia stuartii TaxID=588 RepID=UPI00332A503A
MIESIDKIIDSRVMIPIECMENDSVINLIESDDNSDVSELKIINIPKESIAFTLDYKSTKGGRQSRLFSKLSCYIESKNDDGLNKSCDLVIITKVSEVFRVIVLDLKSKKVRGSRCVHQIENSILFLKYVFSLANHYYEDNQISDDKIKYFKAVITTEVQKESTYKGPGYRYMIKKVPVRVKPGKKATIRYSNLVS